MRNDKNKAIVVLGAGRSGTSMAMQVLRAFKMSSTDELTGPSEQNPLGGQEDKNIFSLHSKVLQDFSTNQLLPLPDGWHLDDKVQEVKDQLIEIVSQNVAQSDTIWGFKDPRTATFIQLWINIFNTTKIIPKYILCVRSPEHVVTSRLNQYSTPVLASELLWLYQYCMILHYTGGNVFILHYEDWFSDKYIETAFNLLNYTGLSNHLDEKDIENVLTDIIKPSLNRSQYINYSIQNQYVRELYESLKPCRGDDFDRKNLMLTVQECYDVLEQFIGWPIAANTIIKGFGKKINALNKEIKDFGNRINALNKDKEKLNELVENKMRKKIEKLILQNNDFALEVKKLSESLEYQRDRKKQSDEKKIKQMDDLSCRMDELCRKKAELDKKRDKLNKEIFLLKTSASFRLGQILINSIKRPGINTIKMPFSIFKLFWEVFTSKRQEQDSI